MHCSLIMHGFHNGKWLILCSKNWYMHGLIYLKSSGLTIEFASLRVQVWDKDGLTVG